MADICATRAATIGADQNQRSPCTDLRSEKMRVGTIGPNNPLKGLLRDVETLLWVCAHDDNLSSSAFLLESELLKDVYSLDAREGCLYQDFPMRAASGCSKKKLDDWLQELDVLIIPEVINSNLVDRAALNGIKRILFIPNLEWALLDREEKGLSGWAELIRNHWPFVVSIARTRSIYQRLTSLGIKSVLIPWSIPDEVAEREFGSAARRATGESRLKLLFNGGGLGFKGRRGADIFIDALCIMPRLANPIDVIFKSNVKSKLPNALLARQDLNLTVISDFLEDRKEIEALYRWADIVAYPSRFEGFGLSLLEALHHGCIVLATDGFPMKELVPDPAMLIDAEMVGYVRQAYRYEPSAADLAKKISNISARPAAYRLGYTDELISRQNRFRRALRRLIRLVGKEYL